MHATLAAYLLGCLRHYQLPAPYATPGADPAFGATSVVPVQAFWRRDEDMVCAAGACDPESERGEDCDPRNCQPFHGATDSSTNSTDSIMMKAYAKCEGREEGECRVRALVLDCPPGVCKDGGQCAPGHEGPVCGVCKEGYAKVSHACHECTEQDRRKSKLVPPYGTAQRRPHARY